MSPIKPVLFLAASLAALETCAAASGKATIPFQFDVDGRAMPAGTYWVKLSHEPSDRLTLQRVEAAAAVSISALVPAPAGGCQCLTFSTIRGRTVLSGINASGAARRLLSAASAGRREQQPHPVVASVPLSPAE
ncbi:MAG TPA: hypothetical protein DEH78_16425 [Solibacterales bacterium]|nr:hypothetical protein [Bryobacterales bacterium]